MRRLPVAFFEILALLCIAMMGCETVLLDLSAFGVPYGRFCENGRGLTRNQPILRPSLIRSLRGNREAVRKRLSQKRKDNSVSTGASSWVSL